MNPLLKIIGYLLVFQVYWLKAIQFKNVDYLTIDINFSLKQIG